MKAVLLAAGEGKRLRPVTARVPKPLLPAGDKAIIGHICDYLRRNGVDEIGIVVHCHENKFREMFAKDADVKLIHQDTPRGTGDALRCARNFCNEEFLCLNGDIVFDEGFLKEVLEEGKKNGNAVMGCVQVENPQEYGVVEQANGKLIKIHEKAKGAGNWINAGIYYFTPAIFDALEKIQVSPRGEYELTEAINMLAENRGVLCRNFSGFWLDVGRPWDLLKANAFMLSKIQRRIEGEVEEYAVVKGNVVIEPGTVVRSGTYIIGPAYIGSTCEIGPNSFIRPSTCIGNKCHVGNASEIKNSILMEDARAPHFNYVGDSIICSGVNLGAGTKIANLRIDGKDVKSFVQGERVNTHLRKFGAIIGENTKIGINCSINPGTVISEDCMIGAGKVLEAQYYAPGTIIM